MVTPLLIASGAARNNAQDARTSDGLVAFAAGRSVALWSSSHEDHKGVHQTLPGHQGGVTSLSFAHDGTGSGRKESSYFVSGDATGTARVWRETGDKWSTVAVLSGHSGSVASVDAVELVGENGRKELLVLTGGSDGFVHVWRVLSGDSAELVHKVDLKRKIPLELALCYLPSSTGLVLAVGGTYNRIQLFTSPSTSQPNFRFSLALDGHTDWVRSLSFICHLPASSSSSTPESAGDYDLAPGELLLASGSQDNYIRLWRFSRLSTSPTAPTPAVDTPPSTGLDALDELEKTLAAVDEEELRVKAHDFVVEGVEGTFSCASEAVLLGHDAWVTGLNWAPHLPSSSSSSQPTLRLLSTSADRSLILWEPVSSGDALPSTSSASRAKAAPHSSFVWTSTYRFGEFSSTTNLGFFGALWGMGGRGVLASGWGGSWHVWRLEGGAEEEGGESWEPQVAITGHLGAVKQVQWEPKGDYLVTCASDMSTRLWGSWRRNGKETWHELARPQIHGYPLASLAFTPNSNRLQFVSGADEKIVRVFDAPGVFLSSLKTLSGLEFEEGEKEGRPLAANVPPLGLSNRAVASSEEAEQLQPASNDPFEAVPTVDFTVTSHPPLEEQLLGSTLWPETEKLYGHSFELVSVTSASSAPLIATACKATLPEHAVIRLFDTQTWRPVGDVLTGHSLTITKLAFSLGSGGEKSEGNRDRWLLSVGRDRTWRVYEREERGVGFYRPFADARAHSRIIWDACWAIDSSFFATASRDKTVKIWTPTSDSFVCSATLKFAEAATSVAVTRLLRPTGEEHVLAVGLENGEIRLFVVGGGEWEERVMLDQSIAHVLTVSTLAFSPVAQAGERTVRLASGSEDHSVRVFDIEL